MENHVFVRSEPSFSWDSPFLLPPALSIPGPSEQKNVELSEKRESPARPQSRTKAQNKPSEVVSVKKILEGVVVVLSGFQNPFRGELRDKALSMGARYRPDWTPDATHLM